MRKPVIIAALTTMLIAINVLAANYDSSRCGSMQIVVNGNLLTIAITDSSGQHREMQFDINDQQNCLGSIEKFLSYNPDTGQKNCPSYRQIEDELIIEGDHITIDGQTYSASDFAEIEVEGDYDDGISFSADLPYYDKLKTLKNEKYTVKGSTNGDRVSFGEVIIDADETVEGDVVALAGNVEVHGEVTGDIVAVLGNIELFDGASVGGDVITPRGKVVESGITEICGRQLPKHKFEFMGHPANVDFDCTGRYNRVEGATLLGGLNYEDRQGELPDFPLDLGYAFALEKWDLSAGFRQEFGYDWGWYFGADAFQGAVTSDEWMLTNHENTLAGLLFKEDFYDFYYRKGVRGFLGLQLGDCGYIEAEYSITQNDTLSKNTDYALFGAKKHFRENYSTVDGIPGLLETIEGERHTAALTFGWDSRDDTDWASSGQLVEVRWESAGDDGEIGGLGGDHSFDRIEATFASYLQVNYKQHIALVLRGGHSDDNLPLDKWFFLGGPSSLRGYKYKEFYGNRFALANIDYFFEFSHDFSLILFGDLGKTAFSYQEFKDNELKSDIGIGAAWEDWLRIDLAQRLDDTDRKPVAMARAIIHF